MICKITGCKWLYNGTYIIPTKKVGILGKCKCVRCGKEEDIVFLYRHK